MQAKDDKNFKFIIDTNNNYRSKVISDLPDFDPIDLSKNHIIVIHIELEIYTIAGSRQRLGSPLSSKTGISARLREVYVLREDEPEVIISKKQRRNRIDDD